jgi:general secretion pathway protein A
VYVAHFGLTERPFSLAPDPRYLFLSEGHREALAHLVYGLQSGGFVQLTGEVGTGKTTVCRALLDQLPRDVDAAMIFSPRLTASELLSAICDELRIEYPVGTSSVKVLIDILSKALLDNHARGRRTVVIIDEAQNLGVEVLEELRLLTNIETTREKLMQIILIGQPELADLMARPALRQLAQRVTARYHLRPFSSDETWAYVRHRVQVAGQRRMMFTPASLRVVHRRSGGVPRLINNICDRALLGAYGRGKTRVTAAIAWRAGAEVFGRSGPSRWLEPVAAVALVAAIIVSTTAFGASRLDYVAAWWAERIVPLDITVPTRPVAAIFSSPASLPMAVLPTPAKPSMAGVLAATPSSLDAALARLFARWDVEYRPRTGEGACDVARRAGLRCLSRTGTWNVIRRLDWPATLTLTTPEGGKHYATVTALGGDEVTLDLAGGPVTLPVREVEQFWDGAFVTLWRLPDLASTDLKAGDDQTRRVAAFQRANGLPPDGVLGEETLLRLAMTVRGGHVPSLTKMQ